MFFKIRLTPALLSCERLNANPRVPVPTTRRRSPPAAIPERAPSPHARESQRSSGQEKRQRATPTSQEGEVIAPLAGGDPLAGPTCTCNRRAANATANPIRTIPLLNGRLPSPQRSRALFRQSSRSGSPGPASPENSSCRSPAPLGLREARACRVGVPLPGPVRGAPSFLVREYAYGVPLHQLTPYILTRYTINDRIADSFGAIMNKNSYIIVDHYIIINFNVDSFRDSLSGVCHSCQMDIAVRLGTRGGRFFNSTRVLSKPFGAARERRIISRYRSERFRGVLPGSLVRLRGAVVRSVRRRRGYSYRSVPSLHGSPTGREDACQRRSTDAPGQADGWLVTLVRVSRTDRLWRPL